MTTGLRLVGSAAVPQAQEEVLDDDLFPAPIAPANTMDATLSIQAIRNAEKVITQYEKQDAQSRAFYGQKIRQCEEHIAAIKLSLLGYLDQHGLKNIATPSGTAYKKTITLKQWPEDSVLLDWVGFNLPEGIRIKREPDKQKISDHIKATGELPEGYEETTETRVYIR